jgi:hypothetical protein
LSWSAKDDLDARVQALRLLLDVRDGHCTRSLEWYPQASSDIPLPVWSQLHEENLIHWYALGGNSFRLTIDGWIETCNLLRDEIGLDSRFGKLSKHLKDLGGRSGSSTHANTIAAETGLSEQWVFEAVKGRMAERIFKRHGATLASEMGDIDVPPHIGKAIT